MRCNQMGPGRVKTRTSSGLRVALLLVGLALFGCVIPTPVRPTLSPAAAPTPTWGAMTLFSPPTTPASPLSTPAPPVSAAPPPAVTPNPPAARVFLPLLVGDRPAPPTPSPPTPVPPPTPTEIPPAVFKPSFGVQIDPNVADLSQVLRWAQGLGCGWIKVQVEWGMLEERPGEYRWMELDRLVGLSHDFNFNLLISVVDAPAWLREAGGVSGPPADPADFGRFMSVLATRYAGKVAAYELWNEPNLAREWHGATLGAADYVTLLAAGSGAVRQADPQARVISAGPGVTGIDDGVTAIDDRRFLREMLAAGAAQWVDGIGVHPYGYGNPPWERAADATHKVTGWNEHPSFFFLDTLEDYHAIVVAAGVDLPLWPTEFGWPAAEGLRSNNLPPDFPYPYAAWLTEQEQAAYLTGALGLMRERPWVGPSFVWNLNTSVVWGAERPESLYSLLRVDTAYRPAYLALRIHQP